MNAFTGAEGEIAVNTSTDTLHVHDGSTAGGHALAKADGSNIATYAGSFTTISASGTITGDVTGDLTGSVLTAAQTNITSLGTLSALTVSGAVTATGLTVNGVSKLKAGSTSTPADTAAFISNAAAKLVVNHGNEYGAYIGYANSSTDAVGIQSTTSGGTTGPLLLNPYGSNVIIGGSTAGDAAADNLTLVDSGNAGMTIQAGDTSYASIYFKDSASPNPGYIQYKQGDDFMRFATGGSEAMRISGGNLLVSKTSDDNSTAGVVLRDTGEGSFVASGQRSGLFNRLSSDGEIVNFRKDGTTVGSIGNNVNNLTINGLNAVELKQGGTTRAYVYSSGFHPWNDATYSLGLSNSRWSDIYLSGGANVGSIVQTGSTSSLVASFENTNTSGYGMRITTYSSGVEYALAVDSYGGGYSRDFVIGVNGYIYSPPTYGLTTGGSANMFVATDGSFQRSTSSLRYKNTVNDATHGLTELLTLRPVTYKGNNDGDTVFGGLIAEEVHDAGLTEFVQYNEDDQPDALAYGNMVSLCIKAIQEQQATIEALTQRIETLENT